MGRITSGIVSWGLRQIRFKLILLLAAIALIANIPLLPAEGQEQTKQSQ
jgi:hypothetical protein